MGGPQIGPSRARRRRLSPFPSTTTTIPTYAARLPSADAVLPYMQRIDASGLYTNRGPLVRELEQRMATMLRLPAKSVTLAASGTAALQAAVLVAAGRARPGHDRALVPAYTFAATAHAAQACGYEVAFADVDLQSWALRPEALAGGSALDRVGVVIPVAPYGRPFATAGWVAFARMTGIPVVIDAAASFEAIKRDPDCVTPQIPVVLSLHATKAFSTAEGGAVLWTDPVRLRRTTEALGFGFDAGEDRSVVGPGLNGKLSEYHAAVGLACLDTANHIAAERARLAVAYAAATARAGLPAGCLVRWPVIASTYALFMAPSPRVAGQVTAAMRAAGVAVRRWYGRGLHREAFFAGDRRGRFPMTEDLADCLLGLPVFPGMQGTQMDRVLQVLRGTCDATATTSRAAGAAL